MNVSYRIDKNTVFVTDERGEVRKIPNYVYVEEILKLENEVEIIQEKIDSSERIMVSNQQKCQQKEYAIWGSKLSTAVILICLTLGSILGIALQSISGLWIALLMIPGIIALNKFDNIIKEYNDLLLENEAYQQAIPYLQQLKQAKEREIQQRKQMIDLKQSLKEETMIEIPKKNYLKLLKEALQTVQSMGIEPSIETVVDAKKAMQKVWKINQ